MPLALILLLLVAHAAAQGIAYGIAVYQGEGVPVAVKVETAPGNGTVEITGLHYYDPLFQLSATQACWEAALAAGKNPFTLNYTVYVEPLGGGRALVGPSLSLAIALATYGELTGATFSNKTIYTGAIAPMGVVAFVGGLREKAEGAAAWGFQEFIYPVLQHNEYKIVLKPRLIGVYGALVERLEVRPLNLSAVSKRYEVGNLYQAVWRYDVAQRLEDVDKKIAEFRQAPLPDATYAAVELVKNETLRLIRRAAELAARRPEHSDVLQNVAARAYALLTLSDPDLLIEAAPRAYGAFAATYFAVKLAAEPDDALREMEIYLSALFSLAEKAVNQTRPGAENICDAAYAAMYYDYAKRRLETARKYATYYRTLRGLEYAVALAEAYGDITAALWRTVIYSTHKAERGVDVETLRRQYLSYVKNAVKYAERYSVATEVVSDLVKRNAMPYAERAEDPLAALGYAMEAFTYAATYFALHPAFPNTTAVKYIHYVDILTHVDLPNELTVRLSLAATGAAELNETRMLHLSRVFACQRLHALAQPAEAHTQTRQAAAKLPQAPATRDHAVATPEALIIAVILSVHTIYYMHKKYKK
jgi:Archaeal serine proteases